jgi:hypothetical protein
MPAVYPSTLPGVSLFDMAAAGQRAQSPPPAHVAQRARTTSRWASARVAWVFDQAELDEFEPWFREDLHRGAAWFLMRLPLTPDSGDPEAPCYSVCRFPAGYSTPFLVPGGWRVEADLEIRDTAECALAPVCDFLTLLQSRFIGNNAADESCWQWGSPTHDGGTLAGEAFVVNRNNGTHPFTPSVLIYEPAGLQSNGTDPLTVEFLATWSASPNTTGIKMFQFTPSILSPTINHLFGWYGDAGRVMYNNDGFGVEYESDSPAPPNCHFMIEFGAAATRACIDGQEVWVGGPLILSPTQMRVHVGDPEGYSSNVTAFTIHGFRVRQEKVYPDGNFTPPTALPSPYL